MQLHGFIDDIVAGVTGTAVAAAGEASKPLLDDVEKRVAKLLFPVVALTAGTLVFNILIYAKVKKL